LQLVYSSCEEGFICCWELESGNLLRTMEDVFAMNTSVELAYTDTLLLGYCSDGGHLWLWNKFNNKLITKITYALSDDENSRVYVDKKSFLVVVNNDLVATSCGDSVQFWDINYRVMIRKVQLCGLIDRLIALDSKSILCCSMNNLYRIDVPLMRFN
uniref:WD_REPEATS_REGION domain-containing protein n=1 Tax=Anisakis simplex TaxID=6269 RepID=A0A0M3J924_ANISI